MLAIRGLLSRLQLCPGTHGEPSNLLPTNPCRWCRTMVYGSSATINNQKLTQSRSRVRGCSRTGGPGCSSLPAGVSDVRVLSVRLLRCVLANAMGLSRAWLLTNGGQGRAGLRGRKPSRLQRLPLCPPLSPPSQRCLPHFPCSGEDQGQAGPKTRVSTPARKQCDSPATRAHTGTRRCFCAPAPQV